MSCSNQETGSEDIYSPIPYSLKIPELFQQKLIDPLIPSNNPLTEEGVALGKKLFFDRKLSGNNTQACASCHKPQNSFTDNTRFSNGIDGVFGSRNSMPLMNLAWNFTDKFASAIANYEADPTTNRKPVWAAKFIDPNGGQSIPAFNSNGNNKRIIRFSDVLLMHAEAENEVSGPTAAAYASINRVRARVDMPAIPAGLSKEDFRQKVRDERTLELCNESQRPLDLLRWGLQPSRFVDNPSFRPSELRYVPGREYFPIPQLEISTNPNYGGQNEGYN